MRARRSLLFVVTLIVGATGAAAEDPTDAQPTAEPGTSIAVVEVVDVRPWINNAMAESVRDKLEIAFDLAQQRVREVPACGDLFHQLGGDGETALSQALYFPVNLRRETGVCRRAVAVTSPGARLTKLCRGFAHLSDSHAAMILIHEALHLAGLTERPSDRDAMTSGQINRMVTEACDLDRGQTREEALGRDSTT